MKSQPRVMHLIDSGGLYGAERVILHLSKGMKKARYYPVFGCILNNYDKKPDVGLRAETLGFKVVYIQQKARFRYTYIKQLRNIIIENNIDILHSHGYKPTIIGYFAVKPLEIPILATCHLWFMSTWRMYLYVVLEAWVMKRIPIVIAVSDSIKNALIKSGVKAEFIKVIDNGIELPKTPIARPTYIRKKRLFSDISEDAKFIVTVGRLTSQKAHEFLIESLLPLLRKDPKVVLLIVGEGPLRENLENFIKRLEIQHQVRLLGYRNDIENIYNSAILFVLSSVDEGLPMVLLEAMANGLPVVATSVGAVPQVLDNGKYGKLVSIGDGVGLRSAVEEIISNDKLAHDLSEKGRWRVEDKYSFDRMCEQYISCYDFLSGG